MRLKGEQHAAALAAQLAAAEAAAAVSFKDPIEIPNEFKDAIETPNAF